MTVPEIPDAVIDVAWFAGIDELGKGRVRAHLAAALTATDEHGRIYYHRDEYLELRDRLEREIEELRAERDALRESLTDVDLVWVPRITDLEARLTEYADALRALLDWLERGDGNRHFLRFTADMARARALLADHCPTCGSTDRHRYAVTSPIGDGPVYEYRLENGGSPERRMLPDGKWERDPGCLDQWHEREGR